MGEDIAQIVAIVLDEQRTRARGDLEQRIEQVREWGQIPNEEAHTHQIPERRRTPTRGKGLGYGY